MTIVKHNQRNLNNVFEEFLAFPSTWGRDFYHTTTPAVNIHENSDGYHIEVAAPGFQKENFTIKLEDKLLIVSVEKKEQVEKASYKTIRREFVNNNFKRSFTLNEHVNTENIEAKYDDGILKIFIPKKEETKIAPKEIAIQ
jgi:HSP20 family protein